MDMRTKLSHQWINGKGIEIGALHFPLSVKHGVTVTYVDRASLDEIIKTHPDVTPVQNAIVIDNAETLATFKNESQDFVIANHVFEHTENPIQTLENWLRVLKPGGVIYAAIPDKRFTFDKRREITPFVHLIIDYTQGPEGSREAHYRDWHTYAEFPGAGVDVEAKVKQSMIDHANVHFHVWDYNSIVQMFEEFKIRLGITNVHIHQNGSEVICICTKGS